MTDKYESLDELFEDEEFEISEESEDNVPLEIKSRLALALDVDDLIDARRSQNVIKVKLVVEHLNHVIDDFHLCLSPDLSLPEKAQHLYIWITEVDLFLLQVGH